MAGLSQAALADLLGVRCCTVSRWEQGVRTPQGPMADRVRLILADAIARRDAAAALPDHAKPEPVKKK